MAMGDDILVVKKELLFKNKSFEGFVSSNDFDFSPIILKNFEYRKRTEELEANPSYKQVIPYAWLVNSRTKKVFLYKRDVTGNERRLMNKFSGGVGGHVDRNPNLGTADPINDAMMRELREELVMENYPNPKVVGFIYDNSDFVGQVHLGVVAIGETDEEPIPAEDMAGGAFFSIDEVEKIFSNPQNTIENWTKISWPFIKDYLNKLN